MIEGIYSLDGDEARIEEFVEVCARHENVAIVCDDAHGTGTLGKGGRGIIEKYGLEGKVPVVISTFSKTFGGIGGILLGEADVVDFIKHSARSFLFSASLPVPIVATANAILDMLEADGEALVDELHEKAAYMRKGLTDIGFDLGDSNSHIMPIMIRDETKAMFTHVALSPRERRADGPDHVPRRERGRRAPPPQRDPGAHLRGHGQGPRTASQVRRLLLLGRRPSQASGQLVCDSGLATARSSLRVAPRRRS
ncbi:MAG: aminotransferase class I/II-fold pyridoxal phosphate-dependent enzyme [Deltaproteobacteria bacterium]|nr:aminotransferase class I/II-fold pyridoxal phosphate-dependent enzyme [Deltaproteobacteria bacterium]